MSPLPISRSALDRLGERLAATEDISEDDYVLLLAVMTAYQDALVETQRRLTALGFEPTTRVKTTSVLIEKLRREQGMKLKGVQDIAGARIVADCNRIEQDEIVRRIAEEFADEARPPKVKDRRAEPSAGYRAVHVIAMVQDVPVEIQVRTWRQDRWAQIAEALGDKWGRGVRYGDGPDDPTRPTGGSMTRLEVWSEVLDQSTQIDRFEQAEVQHVQLASELRGIVSESRRSEAEKILRNLDNARQGWEVAVRATIDALADLVEDLE